MIASVVYVSERDVNPKIEAFLDALYFTVATLTITGFGDITLLGSASGELLAIGMMLVVSPVWACGHVLNIPKNND